ncbi:MAG: DUF3291 domain-containing protein [Chloroflexota bacterium]
MAYQLAQINVGRIKGLPDSEIMKEFMDALDAVNAIADSSPGFIWRLQSDQGNAMDIQAFSDPYIAINMSIWENAETLFEYTYKSPHTEYLRRRKEWFEPYGTNHACLWWVKAEHKPSATEGVARLEYLNEHGPTPYSFTFRKRFPKPGV